MSTTSRNKNLIFIIVVLLLTNIAVLAYFLWFKKPVEKPRLTQEKRAGMMIEMLQKEAGFNDEQIAQYKQLKDLQEKTVKPMFDEMRKAKDSLFRLITNPAVNDSVINSVADIIAQKQKALDLQTFNHFKNLRALCKDQEQAIKYDSAIFRLFKKMGKQMKRGEPAAESKKD
jgi:Spy/CpxP family protein refolding chaperone